MFALRHTRRRMTIGVSGQCTPHMDSRMSPSLHHRTPSLSAIDPRGLSLAAVSYHREQPDVDPEVRFERRRYDVMGRLVSQWDARLWANGGEAGQPNQRSAYSLSGLVLHTASVDAGWRIGLFGDAGQSIEGWDSRGTHRLSTYDEQLRASSVLESLAESPPNCVERFTYGDSTACLINACSRMIRHDDPAGSLVPNGYGLLGHALAQTQRFLANLATPHWPASIPERDALLEPDSDHAVPAYMTRWTCDALAALLRQVDAAGNLSDTYYDVAGQPVHMSLQSGGTAADVLLSDAVYNAVGEMVTGMAGNGVSTTATFSTVDGRLQGVQARRSDKVLQELDYTYDAVGNLLRIADSAQPTDWFAGAQVDPVSHYRYDTSYQLVRASGRESEVAMIQPDLPALGGPAGSGDASRLRNFSQTYAYDAAGNLLTLRHASGGQTRYTRTMNVDTVSNRSLYEADANRPPDFEGSFDANGNVLRLEGSQAMSWNARDQMQQVTQVARDEGTDDDEIYVYDGHGQRRRKVRIAQVAAMPQRAEVRYLPGLEIRTSTITGETFYVAIMRAGHSQVRFLHWEASLRETPPPQIRYGLGDHLGSVSLELDHQGDVISHESYYPYGGTAYRAARSDVEASYKTMRYSGKERDATGLYSYGFRYYAPWLCRWINPDPAGTADGINLYRMLGGNPTSYVDTDGRQRTPIEKSIHQIWIGENPGLLGRNVGTINKNVETAAGYKVNLHMQVENEDAYAETLKELKVHAIHFLDIDDIADDYPKIFNIYDDLRMTPKNFAFAADALRIGLIRKQGGIYLDVDDRLHDSDSPDGSEASFGSATLEAEPHEVLTMHPMGVPWENEKSPEFLQINNSFFAAHASSGILGAVEDEMVKQYDEANDSGKYTAGSMMLGEYLVVHKEAERLKILSGIVGTRVFTNTLAREDAEIGDLLAINRSFEAGNRGPGLDLQAVMQRMHRKMPLSRYNTIGADHTWL